MDSNQLALFPPNCIPRAVSFPDGSVAAPFTDANWTSEGNHPGADGPVFAMAVDGSGNLYIGGNVTAVDSVPATNIAKWDGSSWSGMGSGMGGGERVIPAVYALAISGNDVYAGGLFTTAGGTPANQIIR